jgi:hypothetical protein
MSCGHPRPRHPRPAHRAQHGEVGGVVQHMLGSAGRGQVQGLPAAGAAQLQHRVALGRAARTARGNDYAAGPVRGRQGQLESAGGQPALAVCCAAGAQAGAVGDCLAASLGVEDGPTGRHDGPCGTSFRGKNGSGGSASDSYPLSASAVNGGLLVVRGLNLRTPW